MRILITGLNFSPELVGIGKYTGELAQALVDRGHQVTVVTTPPYYPYWKVQPGYFGRWFHTEIYGDLKIIRCPLWVPGHITGINRVLHLFSFAFSSFGVVFWEARLKPDVIISIAPALAAAPPAALAGKWINALTWLHIQDFEVDSALDLGILKDHSLIRSAASGFEKWIFRKYDRISSISQKMVERLIEKGIPAEKTFLFPNWIDPDAVFPVDGSNDFRQSLGLTAKETVVLYSGSMGAKQGLEVIITAAGYLQSQPNIHFVLCGEGPAKEGLQKAAMGNKNIHFLSIQPAEKLNELLNMADFHVLPQKSNAADLVMPSKLLGMLASARPVIVGCVDGSELYRIVKPVGITVAPEDGAALSTAIQNLADNPAYRTQLGEKGRQFVTREYSKASVLDRFILAIENEHRRKHDTTR